MPEGADTEGGRATRNAMRKERPAGKHAWVGVTSRFQASVSPGRLRLSKSRTDEFRLHARGRAMLPLAFCRNRPVQFATRVRSERRGDFRLGKA